MSNAMLSLMGMYSWDDTLFDDMSFPESFTQEAKEVFVNNLLMECAELEVLYTDWNFLKFAIDNWSAKEVISWNRYYAAMAAQYNPIQNYDRTELTTDTVRTKLLTQLSWVSSAAFSTNDHRSGDFFCSHFITPVLNFQICVAA